MKNPQALFDPDGRKRLAKLVVWGSNGTRLNRTQIERRLEQILERIANAVEISNESH
jgi:hypothetical protein